MQTVIVYVIVAAALAYLGIKVYKALAHKNKGGACEHCHPEANAKKHSGIAGK